jgi:long-subunit fatty acid transport protein
MIKRLLTVVAAALVVAGAAAQVPSVSKFGIWTGASVTKKISSRWSLEAEGEMRTQDALNRIDRWSASLGANYKVLSFLRLGASYTFLYTYNMNEWKPKYDEDDGEWTGYNVTTAYWMPKHRFSFDVTGNYDIGRFSISLRERVQYTYNDSSTTDKHNMRFYGATDSLYLKKIESKTIDSKDKWSLRSRLKVEYNIRHCALTPFVSCEVYNDLKDNFSYQKIRMEVGSEYKINKHHAIDLSYLYCKSNDGDEPDGHIVNVNYAYKF